MVQIQVRTCYCGYFMLNADKSRLELFVGSIPKLNLPEKSVTSKKCHPRKRRKPYSQDTSCKTFNGFVKEAMQSVKRLQFWKSELANDGQLMLLYPSEYDQSKYKVYINNMYKHMNSHSVREMTGELTGQKMILWGILISG
ncbi:unnamed protein product [Clavelina lepadiformis]|uniref:Uncharacterized protein n=1 Tax=Clavelina lepadiformis TaxID=159417 RepID=A0ABP0G114_CLALP